MNQSTSPAADAEAGDATTAVRLGDCRRHPQPLLSICPSVYLSFCLSVLLSICPSACLSFCLYIFPSACLSFCPSLCLYFCVSVSLCVYHTERQTYTVFCLFLFL